MAVLRYFIILALTAAGVPAGTFLLVAHLMKLAGDTGGRLLPLAYIATFLTLVIYISYGRAKYAEKCRHIVAWSVLMVLGMYGGFIWWFIHSIPTV